MKKWATLLILLGGCDMAAGVVGGDDAAPWETVDGFYYKDRSNIRNPETIAGLASVEACRAWVYSTAQRFDDPQIRRGDYQCGVGEADRLGAEKIYRVVVK